MDIKGIKYNRELMKVKARLTRELKSINKMIAEEQEKCNHIFAYIGYNDSYLCSETAVIECIFCKKELLTTNKYPLIEAVTYKRHIYNNESNSSNCDARYKELQNLWIKLVTEYPELDTRGILSKMQEAIEKDERQNKILEKTLGHKIN